MKINFYIHDVLQTKNITSNQLKVGDDMFLLFRKGMEIFENKDAILLTLADSIDDNPEWVEYIKSRPNYKIECHGWDHIDYRKISYKEAVDKLKQAKDKLEKTFNQQISIFHPPKNYYNDNVIKAANEAGMQLREQYMGPRRYLEFNLPINYVDVHYWIPNDVKRVGPIMTQPELKDMTYILGSPRSGTTALMTYIANNDPDILPLREVEGIWKTSDKEIKEYYNTKLKESGRKKILDKNARNGVRLERILKLYPDADFIHIIRDGRAVANSRRTLDMRIGRYDETIEKAAYEWVHFVTYIRNRRKMIKNYREVKYEDLCRYEKYFTSQNSKWKKNLTKSQRWALMGIQEPLLRELGYVK